MWLLACMRDHFQLTAPCNSLSNKYLFIGYYCGKSKLLLVRDSQFLSSPAECPGKSTFAVYLLPDISKSSPAHVVTLYSLWGSRRGGIWALTSASSKAVRFLVPFYRFLLWVLHPSYCKKGGQNLLSSTPESCVDFICVRLKGRAEFSSALEILFPREKSQQKDDICTL